MYIEIDLFIPYSIFHFRRIYIVQSLQDLIEVKTEAINSYKPSLAVFVT
jgi:hypothetical protein